MSKPTSPQPKEFDATTLRADLENLIDQLTRGLVERDLTVRLALLAMLSGEHLLLIGPPGTAKSEIARRLVRALEGGQAFERLLTRFSVPEELFGPLSIKGLEDDRYERKTDGYLPTASVAFIDEIFKANSAILNALLTLLNERKFDNGNERQNAPLLALIGASNELPQEEVLEALYDRFLFRCHVAPVSDKNFMSLLTLDTDSELEIDQDAKLTREDLSRIEVSAAKVDVPERVVGFLASMRKHLASQDIYVSDRRWMKAVKMLQTAALTNGQDEVTIWDCWLLQHCLWNEPEERELIQDWYEERIGAKSPSDRSKFERLVSQFESLLSREASAKSHARNDDGKYLYRKPNGELTIDPEEIHRHNADGDPLYLGPTKDNRSNGGKGYTENELARQFRISYGNIKTSNGTVEFSNYLKDRSNQLRESPQPVMEQTRYSEAHISDRGNKSETLLGKVQDHLQELETEINNLEEKIASHLWVDTDFANQALLNLSDALDSAKSVRQRLEDVRDGFADLPVQKDELEV